MESMFVNRGEYRRLRQAALLPFAQNCCVRVLGNPAYAAQQDAAQALREKCDAYAVALGAAENRGRDTVAAKNEARKALSAALDRLADALESALSDDPLFFTNAGLSLRMTGRRRFNGIPGTPDGLRVSAAKTPGSVLVEFNRVDGARMYALEWSEEPGDSWHNGNYTTARRIAIQLPTRRDLRIRVCAIGTGNRRGGWSAPAPVFIP